MANWFSSIAHFAGHSLGVALLNTVWQSAILYVLLRLALLIFKNAPAAAKYALGYTTLAAACIWFVSNWVHNALIYYAAAGATGTSSNAAWLHSYPTTYTQQPYSTGPILHSLENYVPLFWCLYIPGFLIMTARLTLNMLWIRSYRKQGISQHLQLQHTLEGLQWQMNITRRVNVYLSTKVQVPVMMGILKPFILLPATLLTQLNEVQLQAILLHELAHIKRHDYLLNMVQVFAETVLFFNPFVWLINSIIRREREHCCDDMVVDHCQQPYQYATALASLEQYRTTAVTALAATGNQNYLFTRIKRIIEMNKKPVNRHYMASVVLVCVALLVPLFVFTTGFAQKKDDKGDSKKASKIIIITDSVSVKQNATTSDIDVPEPPDAPDAPDEADKQDKHGKHQVVIIDKKYDETINGLPDDIAAAVKMAMGTLGDSTNMAYLQRTIAIAQREIERITRDHIIEDAQKEVESAQEEIARIKKDHVIENAQKEVKSAQKEIARIKKDHVIENAQKEVESAQKEIARIKKDHLIENAQKETEQAQQEIDKIDWNAINKDIADAMKEVTAALADPDLHKAIKTIDTKIVVDNKKKSPATYHIVMNSKMGQSNLRQQLQNSHYKAITVYDVDDKTLQHLIAQYNGMVQQLDTEEKVERLDTANPIVIKTVVELEALKKKMLDTLNQLDKNNN